PRLWRGATPSRRRQMRSPGQDARGWRRGSHPSDIWAKPVEPIVHADRDGADLNVGVDGSAEDVDSGADVRRPANRKQRLVIEFIVVVLDEGRPVVGDHPLETAADRPSAVSGVEDRRARKYRAEEADRRLPHTELGVDPAAAAFDIEQRLRRPAGPAEPSGDTREAPGPHPDAAASKRGRSNAGQGRSEGLADPIVGILTEAIDVGAQKCALHAENEPARELVVAAHLPTEYRAAAVDVAAGGRTEYDQGTAAGKGVELALGDLVALPTPAHLRADKAAGPAPRRSRRRLQRRRGRIGRIARMRDRECGSRNARQK